MLFYNFQTESVSSGPKRFGLDMSTSAARRSTGNLYVVVLSKKGKDPLGPRSDEAIADEDAKKGEDDGRSSAPSSRRRPSRCSRATFGAGPASP